MAAADTRAVFEDGLPMPRRIFAVATVMTALGMSVLDSAIVNVALPTIAGSLGVEAASSIWIINAYQLAIVVCLLPFAALGEKLGYRRVYLTGLAVFALGSMACAFAQGFEMLVAARVLQGIGAGSIMSVSSALTRFNYPARMLGRGIGLNAVVISITAASGPTLGALIIHAFDWRWLFAINIPLAAAAIAVGLRALPYTPPALDRKFDWIAAILNAFAFGGLILGAESIVREGLAAGALKLVVGAVAAVLLVQREISREAPLVPFDLLRIPVFRLSVGAATTCFTAQMLTFVAVPFYFQAELGYTALETGLLITPWPIAVGIVAPIAGRLADRMSAGLLGGAGLIVFSIGLFLLSRIGHGASDLDIAWRMAVCGLGFGFFQSPNNRTIVASAPKSRAGAAGGMLAVSRLLGQTTGAVTMAVFLHMGGPATTPAALKLASALALAASVVSFLRLRTGREPHAKPQEAVADG